MDLNRVTLTHDSRQYYSRFNGGFSIFGSDGPLQNKGADMSDLPKRVRLLEEGPREGMQI